MFLTSTKSWYIERIVWLLAGVFTLTSLTLSQLHSEYWLLLAGLVGINLTILSLTGFCPTTALLHKLGVTAKCGRESQSKSNG